MSHQVRMLFNTLLRDGGYVGCVPAEGGGEMLCSMIKYKLFISNASDRLRLRKANMRKAVTLLFRSRCWSWAWVWSTHLFFYLRNVLLFLRGCFIFLCWIDFSEEKKELKVCAVAGSSPFKVHSEGVQDIAVFIRGADFFFSDLSLSLCWYCARQQDDGSLTSRGKFCLFNRRRRWKWQNNIENTYVAALTKPVLLGCVFLFCLLSCFVAQRFACYREKNK